MHGIVCKDLGCTFDPLKMDELDFAEKLTTCDTAEKLPLSTVC